MESKKLISDLHLSERVSRILGRNDILTVTDLTRMTESELSQLYNMGVASIAEVKGALYKLGLSLKETGPPQEAP